MQLNRSRNTSDVTMTSEAPCSSGQWLQQELTSVVPNIGKAVHKNVSVQTGEEFSMEFLQDRVSGRGIPAVPITAPKAQNHEKKVGQNYVQNHQLGYEDLARILGLRRMDSECASDISDLVSANGSLKEIENGVCGDKFSKNHKEDSDSGYGARRAFGELNGDRVSCLEPTALPTYLLESPHGNNFNGPGISDGSQSGKMKFLCSFGGKILSRPSDGKLRYVGGETRIISIRTNLSWEELMKKTLVICNQPHSIKYQLPGEDLDALISMSSDEDLQNMIEEYRGLEKLEGSQRLRLFLIPFGESESTSSFEATTIQQNNPDYQYVVAVNGIMEPSPRKNTGVQGLASEANQLGTNLDCNPIFHKCAPTSMFPLEIKGGLNALHSTQFGNESNTMIGSSNQSPQISPFPLQRGDSKSFTMRLHGNNSSIESSSSFISAQLPPEDSSTDTASHKHPMQGLETLINCHHPYNQIDANQPEQSRGTQYLNHDYTKEFANRPALDHKHSEFDGFSCERYMHKERTFHSETPISHPDDPIALFSESIGSIGTHQGMPHAYSDSKLQEYGGSPAYCSLERMSPSSPLNFAKKQLSSLPVSNVFQEKPMQLHENVNLLDLRVQNNLVDIESTGLQGDMLHRSPCPESATRSESICTSEISDKSQTANDDLSKSNFMRSNHFDGNSSSLRELNGTGKRDLLLDEGGNFYEGRSFATSMEYRKDFPIDNCNHTSTSGVDTFTQDIQISGDMSLAFLASGLKSSEHVLMEHPNHHELNKTPSDHFAVGQTAYNQHSDLGGTMLGGQQSSVSWTKNFEVAGLFSNEGRGSRDENYLSDLISGPSNGLYFHESEWLQPVVSQNDTCIRESTLIASTDLSLPSVHAYTGSSSHLHNNDLCTLLLNPTTDVSFKREVSPLDDNFVIYPDEKVDKVGFGGSFPKKSNVEEVSLTQTNPTVNEDLNQLDAVNVREDVVANVPASLESLTAVASHVMGVASSDIMSPDATELESMIPEFGSEDSRADGQDKDESFSDAMIAEMEASIYGLQIIRNADLEELQELGSGTYGTVYLGKWRGTDVAIKRIKKSCFAGRSSEQERLTKDFWREAQILSNLHHPNVVAFYGVVPDGIGGTLATVTEFMVNGSLRHVLLKKDRLLDRRKKLIIAMDAAFGMEYLHSKNIVHFDLKCDNLLVNLRDPQRPICKVGDFGLSRIKRNTLVSGGVRGTLPWMAPELLNGSSSRVSEKVDVFSFGISMWEILTGEEPYADMHCGAIIGGIVKNTLRPAIPECCDPNWRKLMEQCWSPYPETRPSFTEITNRLRSMSLALQAEGLNNQPRYMKPNATT
ncbi:hypothetical protein LWI28_007681 [Acer negundo]|uniref:Protein kinase domain-containing protein n=1 Tax=Acer negundo TaxID=4023 RepID=A0AAD5IZ63_ACENE|nr:hypothetical protein LWI28_007681 [Acer negundo]